MVQERPAYVLRVHRRDALTDSLTGHPRDFQVRLGVLYADEVPDVYTHFLRLSAAPHLGLAPDVFGVLGRPQVPSTSLKKAMPISVEAEGRTAEEDWIPHFWCCAHDVLNHPGDPNSVERIPSWGQQVWVIVLPYSLRLAVELARRGRMYEIESVAVGEEELNSLGLYELIGIAGLEADIYAHQFKPRAVVARSCASLAAVEVKNFGDR
ncbi:hypothetical protein [Streptomyces sp. NPDC051561]|uniref:hypothetical protein n=1 Tax=Streptomyces sp. NPDC051561 TaxID=3365658 RepID=UPI00379ADCA4